MDKKNEDEETEVKDKGDRKGKPRRPSKVELLGRKRNSSTGKV